MLKTSKKFPYKTPNGYVYMETVISKTKASYWVKVGEGPDDLIHLDTKGTCSGEELDVLIEYMNFLHERAKS